MKAIDRCLAFFLKDEVVSSVQSCSCSDSPWHEVPIIHVGFLEVGFSLKIMH